DLRGVRGDLLLGERPHRLAQRLVLLAEPVGVEVGVHAGQLNGTQCRCTPVPVTLRAMNVRRGRSAEGRAEVRRALVAAAVRLFRTPGYEEPTVDDIAASAGVWRRPFFRYVLCKADVLWPDHEVARARGDEE